MLGPLDQLQQICGERRVMIGFDRGGSYPKVFSDLRDRGLDWVTYRRAPLPAPAVKPRSSWVTIDGRRHSLRVADEQVELDGYGTARQLTVYEHGRVALQILTSDRTSSAARLARTLRCRWCIENTFKYLEGHHGLHWLADYHMNLAPDTTLVRNPERTTALAQLRSHEQSVAKLEQQLGRHHTTTTPTDTNSAETLCMLQAGLYTAHADTRAAKAALKPIPAKLPANTIDPTPSARHHASTAARCRPSAAYSPTTQSSTSPARSTPTSKTPTNTARSPATSCTNPDTSTTHQPGSPSRSTNPTHHASHAR
jgi:hypothetical protein